MGTHVVRVWHDINRELFRTLGSNRYDVWVRNARFAWSDDEELLLHFPTSELRERIERWCRPSVEAAARRATNRNLTVRFEVDLPAFPSAPETTPASGRVPQTFDRFVAGPSNLRAWNACRRVGTPGFRGTLLLFSSSGLGKTHLLRAIRAEIPAARLLFFPAPLFVRDRARSEREGTLPAFRKRARSAHVLLIDDLHHLAHHPEAARELAHLLEERKLLRSQTVLASTDSPARFELLSASVRNRLSCGNEVSIGRPDPETRFRLLRSRSPSSVPDEPLRLLAERITSSPRDLLECLRSLLDSETAPSLSAADKAASEFLNRWSGGLSFEDIARAASEQFGVRLCDLYSDVRTRTAVEARHACFYLSRRLLGRPYEMIGRHFGDRGHATVLDACRALQRTRRSEVRTALKKLERRLTDAHRVLLHQT